ncbi:hypothetical protein D9M69_702490 [compost metagenome]
MTKQFQVEKVILTYFFSPARVVGAKALENLTPAVQFYIVTLSVIEAYRFNTIVPI